MFLAWIPVRKKTSQLAGLNMFKRASLPRVNEKASSYGTLIWIMLLAFALRVGLWWYTHNLDFWQNGYGFFFALAQGIAAGDGYAFHGGPPTAFRVPLYPMFLAGLTFGQQSSLPIVVGQSLIGAGTVLCAAMLAREMFGSTSAIIAAILTALYPYYVVHDTALQETSLYTFLMAVAMLLLLRARRCGSAATAAGAGFALGVGVLTRANLALFALFAPFWLALVGGLHDVPWRRRLCVAVLCASAGALVISPWLIRSYRITGSVTLSGQSGLHLWLGNNPQTLIGYPEQSIDRTGQHAFAALSDQDRYELEHSSDKAAVDKWYQQKGWDYIREDPWRTIGNGFRKIVAAFGWLPSPRHSFWPNLVYALSYGPVMILGLWGMWSSRSQWREFSIFYMQFVAFVAVTAVYFGHTSYRAYLDVYWIVFAAGALVALLSNATNYHLRGLHHQPERSRQIISAPE
jgi:4-amino-4-deoxy-L-arabinose transferase-like glycosyltransferase